MFGVVERTLSRRAAVNAHASPSLLANGHGVCAEHAECRRRPAFGRRQREPELQQPNFAFHAQGLAVNDTTPGSHPLHVTGRERAAFLPIVNGPFEQ